MLHLEWHAIMDSLEVQVLPEEADESSSSSSSCANSFSSHPIPSSSESDLSDFTEGRAVRSLLDVLHCPAPSDLARKRKVPSNPPKGKKRSTSRANSPYEPKSVSARERVMEFKTEPLTISCGKLFCSACREPVSLKKSIIKLHVKSQKHESSYIKMKVFRGT